MEEIENRFEILDIENAQEQEERRARQKAERERKLQEIEDSRVCEFCGGQRTEYKNDPEWVGSMTRYYWDIDKSPERDPNRKNFLCFDCAEEDHMYWQERWDDYYSGIMG